MKRILFTGRSSRGWSRVGKAFRCRRLYALTAAGFLRDDAIDADAVRIGTLGHVGLAHIMESWRLSQHGQPNDLEPWERAILFTSERLGVELQARRAWQDAEQIAIRAVTDWQHDHPEPPGEILAVEQVIEGWLGWRGDAWGLWETSSPVAGFQGLCLAPDGSVCYADGDEYNATGRAFPDGREPVTITRRQDTVVRERDGIWVWDHKFKGWARPASVKRKYRGDGQFAPVRILGRQIWGSDFQGAKINCVRTTAEKGHHESYLIELPRAPHLDASFPFALLEEEKWIADLEKRITVDPTRAWWERPAMHEEVCVGSYGECPALDACLSGGR